MIPEPQAAALADTIEEQFCDWRKLLSIVVASVSAALSDRMLQDLLEIIFEAPAILKCPLAFLAAWLFR